MFGTDAAPLRKARRQRPSYVQSHLSDLQQRLAQSHSAPKGSRFIFMNSTDALGRRIRGKKVDRFFLTRRHGVAL